MDSTEKSSQLDPDLSRRLHHALTCGKEELFQALLDPSMEVLRSAFRNPALDENHLLALLGRRDLTEELLKAANGLEAVAASHKLKVALVHNPGTPGQVVLSLLPHLYLFELANICFLPGVTPDQKVAAERAIIQRLPTTPLGNKITLARQGTPAVLEVLLKEGDIRVVEPCLTNPRLREASVFQLVSSPRASAEVIGAVARHPRWCQRPNLKGAILKNPMTPLALFGSLLSSVALQEVKNIAVSPRLGPDRKRLAQEELRRRNH